MERKCQLTVYNFHCYQSWEFFWRERKPVLLRSKSLFKFCSFLLCNHVPHNLKNKYGECHSSKLKEGLEYVDNHSSAGDEYAVLLKYRYYLTECISREIIRQNPLRCGWHESNKIACLEFLLFWVWYTELIVVLIMWIETAFNFFFLFVNTLWSTCAQYFITRTKFYFCSIIIMC